MENTPVMLPRFASHEAATSPISWLSTWQPQLPISAASAADLESPLSKPHVHAKSPAQRLAQTLARCLPNSFLPQSIAAEF